MGYGIHHILIVIRGIVQPQGIGQNADFLAVVPVYGLPKGADTGTKLPIVSGSQNAHNLRFCLPCHKFRRHCQPDVGIHRGPEGIFPAIQQQRRAASGKRHQCRQNILCIVVP